MTTFRIAITSILPPREGRAKYLVTLSTEIIEGEWATIMPVSDHTALHTQWRSLGYLNHNRGGFSPC